MKTRRVSWTKGVIFGCAMMLLTGCDSSVETPGAGDVQFEITDAPSDDASIQSVFITIAEIKVNGQSVPGFTRTTFDLKAFSEGNVKVLGSSKLLARDYSTLTLVLDTDTDANGSAPGCYALTKDNAKFKLRSSGTVDVVINKSWRVAANSTSRMVIDFDLRKAIRTMDDQMIRYNFVSNSNLQAAVRLVVKEKTGTIVGHYTEQIATNADLVVVYAYKKGTYNANVEMSEQGEDAIRFKNAVASSEVNSGLNQTFTLAFLEEGDYEIHFAKYNKEAASERYIFQSMLNSTITSGGLLEDHVTVQAGVTISVSSQITGTL